jgi:hypothetical protein
MNIFIRNFSFRMFCKDQVEEYFPYDSASCFNEQNEPNNSEKSTAAILTEKLPLKTDNQKILRNNCENKSFEKIFPKTNQIFIETKKLPEENIKNNDEKQLSKEKKQILQKENLQTAKLISSVTIICLIFASI